MPMILPSIVNHLNLLIVKQILPMNACFVLLFLSKNVEGKGVYWFTSDHPFHEMFIVLRNSKSEFSVIWWKAICRHVVFGNAFHVHPSSLIPRQIPTNTKSVYNITQNGHVWSFMSHFSQELKIRAAMNLASSYTV